MFLPINLLKKFFKIISMTNSQFNPALPLPIKFNINDGKFGNQLTLCIPVESVTHFMEHIQNLVNTKQSDGKVYTSQKKTFKLNERDTLKRWKETTGFMATLIPEDRGCS